MGATSLADAVSELDVAMNDMELHRAAAFNLARAVADFCLPHLADRVTIYAILQKLEAVE